MPHLPALPLPPPTGQRPQSGLGASEALPHAEPPTRLLRHDAQDGVGGGLAWRKGRVWVKQVASVEACRSGGRRRGGEGAEAATCGSSGERRLGSEKAGRAVAAAPAASPRSAFSLVIRSDTQVQSLLVAWKD